MLIVKIYRQGIVAIRPLATAVVVDPTAPLWQKTLTALEKSTKEILNANEPYKILTGTTNTGVDVFIGLFGSDTCYVTTNTGDTIEAIRPAKPKAPTTSYADFDKPQSEFTPADFEFIEPIERTPQSPPEDG